MEQDELRRLYVDEHLTVAEIAKVMGVSVQTAYLRMAEAGVRRRTPAESRALRGTRSGRPSIYPQLHDTDWLRREYIERCRTQEEIASELGCSGALVNRKLQEHGIPARTVWDTRNLRGTKRASKYWQLDDAEWMRAQYEAERTLTDMASEIGCSGGMLSRAMKRFGIPIRPAGSHLKGKKSNSSKREDGTPGVYHSGYTSVYVDGEQMPEHRYVAEQKIGRPLKRGEVVHHINGIRDDNQADNLEVFPSNSAHRKHHQELAHAHRD